MADILISNSPNDVLHVYTTRTGIFWKTTSIGYQIYLANGGFPIELVWRKTTDGGATWGAEQIISANGHDYLDAFADWEVPGDTGKVIHICACEYTNFRIRYYTIDTSTDTVSAGVNVHSYPDKFAVSTRSYEMVTIAKSRGGLLGVAFIYTRADASISTHFFTSPDGAAWTDRNCIWDNTVNGDQFILFPGNAADPDDFWGLYWDFSTSEIYLHTYDASLDSWSSQLISGGFTADLTQMQYAGVVRKSDGHLLMCAWEAKIGIWDYKTFDINGAASITAKTDVVTATSTGFLACIQIDQTTDYVYAFYALGTKDSSNQIYMFTSTDGMATWDGGTDMQQDASDDERCIFCGPAHPVGGGWIMPSWFNDDTNRLFTNIVPAIEITGTGGGNPPMQSQAVKSLLMGNYPSGKGS